jgi:hypothetical protein
MGQIDYTTVEQSKELSQFLPKGSSNLAYIKYCTSDNPEWRFGGIPMVLGDVPIGEIATDTLPCWSSQALFDLLPKKIQEYEKSVNWFDNKWQCKYCKKGSENMIEISSENLIDVYVTALILLNKMMLL